MIPISTPLSPESSLTVTELNGLISELFAYAEPFQQLWVTGEIGGLKTMHTRQQTYFYLTDGEAKIDCVCFRDFPFKTGDAIRAKGSIQFYRKKGTLQFQVTYALPLGSGSLEEQLKQLANRLKNEGVFNSNNRMPDWINRMAIITASPSAALSDIVSSLSVLAPSMELMVIPTLMQGLGAPRDITDSIQFAQQTRCDVILIARGGGSADDLLPFHDEGLCRAIHASPTPIVTAIGHETDRSLADFAATHYVATPTAAAHYLAQPTQRLLQTYPLLGQHIHHMLGSLCKGYNDSLRQYGTQMARCLAQHTHLAMDTLSTQLRIVEASSPLRKLTQGYSIVRQDSGSVVSSSHHVKTGDTVLIQLHDGTLSAKIIS